MKQDERERLEAWVRDYEDKAIELIAYSGGEHEAFLRGTLAGIKALQSTLQQWEYEPARSRRKGGAK